MTTARDRTIHLELKIDVSAADWLLTYGTGDSDKELNDDAANHLQATAREAIETRLLAQGNGAKLDTVNVTRTYVQPRVLVEETLAAIDRAKLPDYPFLRLWGRYMGSYDPYINEQVRRARDTGAPWTAIYHRDDHPTNGGWHTFEEILNPDAIIWLRTNLERLSKQA